MGFQVAAVVPSPCPPSTSSRSPFLGGGGGCGMLARSWAPGGLVSRRRGEGRPARCALSASIDGVGGGDMEFLRRIEELAASAGVRTAGCGWPPSLEQSASSVGLPLSLRILKRKKQQRRQQVPPRSRWDERLSLGSAGESVGRAFSSMVLIVRELQSFALQQMLCDDLQAVLARAHGEMQDSFVWLFQHIFAGTPALMLSLMLLLANFTVHSMSNSVAAAAVAPTPPAAPAATVVDTQHTEPSNPRFDAASVKTFSAGRTASVGGGSGGGGDVRPVAGASGDDRGDESRYSLSRVAPQQLTPLAGTGVENVVPGAAAVDEQAIWERMVAEASSMQADARADELTDPDVLGNLVAPVEAEIETEDVGEYARTEQRYKLAVSEEPNNSLILANFAQFLYITRKDHKR
ncbi:unnamed protein product [Triticum turgidum subsp. durum]|nr:unnamed protein product [Triticum turgidum subsp. durum]